MAPQIRAIVDMLLTNVSQAYVPDNFIADQVLPEIPVVQTSGKIGKYGSDHLRIVNTLMGGRGEARRVNVITRNSDTYLIEKHGLEDIVTAEDYKNVIAPFDAEKDVTLGLTTLIKLGKEKALADTLSNTSVLTQNATLSGTAQLNDFTNSDPIAKIQLAQAAVYAGCGMAPNVAIMGWAVRQALRYHPKILAALGFQYNRAGLLSDDEIAKALSVDKILVGAAMYNGATEGQTDSFTPLWGKHLLFAVIPKSPAPYQTSLGYSFVEVGARGPQTFKYPLNNPPNATGVLVQDSYDTVLTNVKAAYLYKNAVA